MAVPHPTTEACPKRNALPSIPIMSHHSSSSLLARLFRKRTSSPSLGCQGISNARDSLSPTHFPLPSHNHCESSNNLTKQVCVHFSLLPHSYCFPYTWYCCLSRRVGVSSGTLIGRHRSAARKEVDGEVTLGVEGRQQSNGEYPL